MYLEFYAPLGVDPSTGCGDRLAQLDREFGTELAILCDGAVCTVC